MAKETEFQQKVRQLGALVGELEQTPGVGSKVPVRELIQLLMEVHGSGLERIMELIFESGSEGEAMIARLGQDPITRSLLLLYSLHPDDVETRVLKAIDMMGPRLRKFDFTAELVEIREGAVQIELHASRKAHGSHGSAAKNVRAIVEEAVYDLAPDIASLTILGLEDEHTAGFVSLESLLHHPATVPELAIAGAQVSGAAVSGVQVSEALRDGGN